MGPLSKNKPEGIAVDTQEDEVLIYPHALIGYRVWQLKDGQLYPLHAKASAWEPGSNDATCNKHEHQAPAPDCKCGFNAHHQLRGAIEEAEHWRHHNKRSDKVQILVIGAIAGKGQVELHRSGFRCQSAQILALLPIEMPNPERTVCIGSSYKAVSAAADHYQVPLYDQRSQLRTAIADLKERYTLITAPEKLLPELTTLLDDFNRNRQNPASFKKYFVAVALMFLLSAALYGVGAVSASPALFSAGRTLMQIGLFFAFVGAIALYARMARY